jgi:hypothetical protein
VFCFGNREQVAHQLKWVTLARYAEFNSGEMCIVY